MSFNASIPCSVAMLAVFTESTGKPASGRVLVDVIEAFQRDREQCTLEIKGRKPHAHRADRCRVIACCDCART